MKILSDIIIEVCYTSNKNKQFVWDICGEQIIKNLLSKNNNRILILKQSQCGGVHYDGLTFEEKYIECEVDDEVCIKRTKRSREDY
jgi:hypothetical protein